MKSFFKMLLAAFVGTLAALIIAGFIFIAAIGSLASLGEESNPVVPSKAILTIDLAQGISEQDSDDPFPGISPAEILKSGFSTKEKTLGILNAEKAIRKAAADPSIKMIYLNSTGINIGLSQLEELRNSLSEFRQSGKPIIAYSSYYTQGTYYISSVADKIYINGGGEADIHGFSATLMFFKDIMAKLGVKAELIRHGKYKSAAEQYMRNNLSNPNKLQYENLLGSIWDNWASDICESRRISRRDLDGWVNNLSIIEPDSLVSKEMVDGICSEMQIKEKLCTQFDVKKPKDLKFISLYNYAKARKSSDLSTKNKIAVIYAQGEISGGGDGITPDKFCPIIDKVTADSSVKAVVLRVNSPGGEVLAAQTIKERLDSLKAKKPLITSYGDYAASGGYWISANSDIIFTDRTTITGSIGVFGLYFHYENALEKLGKIHVDAVKTHDHADVMNGLSPLDPLEKKKMEESIERIYSQFTNIVAEGRSLSPSYVDSIGQGRVWSGSDAIKNKLADTLGGLSEAISYAAEKAGLKKYRTVEYPAVKTYAQKIVETLGNLNGEAEILSDPLNAIKKSISRMAKSDGERVYSRLPYVIDIRY
ncbi:MAG: signal peptide peptidase SppA [Bacteroidales bacterium]|nr:signal peptide peptidase SppA [Bacteroidales bacterium]